MGINKFSSYHRIVFSVVMLVSIGYKMPIKAEQKAYLYLHHPEYHSGMFSIFLTVAGFLQYYDSAKDQFLGAQLNFEDKGLYYDPNYGPNWWEYYCEPICLGYALKPQVPIREFYYEQDCAWLAAQIEFKTTREQVFNLIQKYIHIKPHLQEKLNTFMKLHFNADFIIGIHYRGTDKDREAPKVSYQTVFNEINQCIQKLELNDSYKIFVATDEQQFLDALQRQFPDRVIAYEAIRSTTGVPVHHLASHCYQKGEEALLDCLLLSNCHFLIRTSSNLSLWSTYFNPTLPVVLLNDRSHRYGGS